MQYFLFRSKAFAITRNVEDLAAAKMTPVVAAGTELNVLRQTFNPRDLSAGDTPRTQVTGIHSHPRNVLLTAGMSHRLSPACLQLSDVYETRVRAAGATKSKANISTL